MFTRHVIDFICVSRTQKKAKSRRYPTNIDYADDLALLANTPAQAELRLQCLQQTAGVIDIHVNANKTEFMRFKRKRAISTPSDRSLNLLDKFTYLGCNISSTERDVNIPLAKVWTAIDRFLILCLIYLMKIKRDFFQGVAVSILLHGCTIWTLTKYIEKKIGGNYTRMLQAILNKSWKQHLWNNNCTATYLPSLKLSK